MVYTAGGAFALSADVLNIRNINNFTLQKTGHGTHPALCLHLCQVGDLQQKTLLQSCAAPWHPQPAGGAPDMVVLQRTPDASLGCDTCALQIFIFTNLAAHRHVS